MFRPVRVSLREAEKIVAERLDLAGDRANPLHSALKEGELFAETKENGNWVKHDAGWYESTDVLTPQRYAESFPQDGLLTFFDIMVEMKDLDRLWPVSTQSVNKAGRPAKYDWEGALIHLSRQVFCGEFDPIKDCQSEVVRRMRDWFIANRGEEPSDTLLKERAKRFLDEISRE